jgi:hypothetical protein
MRAVAFLYLDSSDDPRDTLAQFHAARLLPLATVLVDDAQEYAGHALGKATLLAAHLDTVGIPYTVTPTHPGYAALQFTLPPEHSKIGL